MRLKICDSDIYIYIWHIAPATRNKNAAERRGCCGARYLLLLLLLRGALMFFAAVASHGNVHSLTRGPVCVLPWLVFSC